MPVHLDPDANPLYLTGTSFGRLGSTPPLEELASHLESFESIGVAYVVGVAEQPIRRAIPTAHEVFDDRSVATFKLDRAAPFFSARPSLALVFHSFDEVSARCSKSAVLEGEELFYPGWQATVNGERVPVRADGPLFEEIDLSQGSSLVTISYRPTHERVGDALALASVAGIAGALLLSRRRRRRRRHRTHSGIRSISRAFAPDSVERKGSVPAVACSSLDRPPGA